MEGCPPGTEVVLKRPYGNTDRAIVASYNPETSKFSVELLQQGKWKTEEVGMVELVVDNISLLKKIFKDLPVDKMVRLQAEVLKKRSQKAECAKLMTLSAQIRGVNETLQAVFSGEQNSVVYRQ